MKPAILVLEDGTFFTGIGFGHDGKAIGEIACDTGMANYVELLTDPTSKGRLLSLTTNNIGNHGVVAMDVESEQAHAAGLIVRNCARIASNFRSTSTLPDFLADQNVTGITEVDTRAVMVHIRENGNQMGMIVHNATAADVDSIVKELRAASRYEEATFNEDVGTKTPVRVIFKDTGDKYHPRIAERASESTPWPAGLDNAPEIVVLDLGVRNSLLEELDTAGAKLTLVPSNTKAQDILARKPAGVFISNGPGNPQVWADAQNTVRELVGKVPIFAVGLGFQLLSVALGGETYKLPAGEHGQNIPVRSKETGRAYITTMRRSFGVRFPAVADGVELTHTDLNDQSVCGVVQAKLQARGVQHDPESDHDPQDVKTLLAAFVEQIATGTP